jgi:hypothetical protein
MAAVVVEIEDPPLERVVADLAVVGVSPDDRPLTGSAGRADWRLSGRLWQLVASQTWNPEFGQAALLSAAGSLRARLLLVVGLGPRSELGIESWWKLGQDVARRATDLGANRAVMGVSADAANLGPEGTAALFSGSAVVAAGRRRDLALVMAGEGSRSRLADLHTLSIEGLPAGAELRLPERARAQVDPPSRNSGAFSYR